MTRLNGGVLEQLNGESLTMSWEVVCWLYLLARVEIKLILPCYPADLKHEAGTRHFAWLNQAHLHSQHQMLCQGCCIHFMWDTLKIVYHCNF